MSPGPVSGKRVTFVGDGMAAVVQGIVEVHRLIGQPPVVVGGLAVLARLSQPYRATVDLDVVDRLRGAMPQLEVLRAADGAQAVEPAAVLLPTRHGAVKVDVLEVRQVELDRPSDDPGDRLHASAHAWAHDSATDLAIEVMTRAGERVEAVAPAAEPVPLIAMKLQAVMNRAVNKQRTDLLDIVRLSSTLRRGRLPCRRSQPSTRRWPVTSRGTSTCGWSVSDNGPCMDPSRWRRRHHARRHRLGGRAAARCCCASERRLTSQSGRGAIRGANCSQ